MPEVDLTKLTPGELKNLLKNCQRHGQLSKATEVIQEMSRRGIATGVQYRTLTWNQGRVDEVMKPFQEIALMFAFKGFGRNSSLPPRRRGPVREMRTAGDRT